MEKWIVTEKSFEADEINPGLSVSPWSGHRQFAYDLTVYVKPQRIVELGTHYGCSFFSFLQACKDKEMNTEVVAIDCWEGDEQAGFYGGEVLDTVKKTLDQKFPRQNYRLIRKYFADAVRDIEDASVDILHIDGLHTYEAVSEDYRTWLCKLKPDGIMLFHDVASELGYGTNAFWSELQEKFPGNYMFSHSWGLGVLFPKGKRYYEAFEANDMRDKVVIYEYKARYALEHRQLQDHIRMVQERDAVIQKNEKMIDERDEAIRKNERMIDAKDEAIRENERMIDAKDEVIRENERMIDERDRVIRENERMIDAKDEVIRENERMIDERDAAIRENEKMIDAKDELIEKCEEMIRTRDEAIKSNERMIDERDALIKLYEERLEKRG